MEKINFENLPSTNTPINATNLNQMQTNIENTNIITASISSSHITTTTEIENLNLDKKVRSRGSNLTLENGSVKIGKNINWIDVSANVYMRSGQSAGEGIQCSIRKNNSSTISSVYKRMQGAQTENVILPTVSVPVTEGDLISLSVQSSTESGQEIGAFESLTYLNVREV